MIPSPPNDEDSVVLPGERTGKGGGGSTVVDEGRLARRVVTQEEHHRAGRDILGLGKGPEHALIDWQEGRPASRSIPCDEGQHRTMSDSCRVAGSQLDRMRDKDPLVKVARFPLEILGELGVGLPLR